MPRRLPVACDWNSTVASHSWKRANGMSFTYVIGDVHGRDDLLVAALGEISRERRLPGRHLATDENQLRWCVHGDHLSRPQSGRDPPNVERSPSGSATHSD